MTEQWLHWRRATEVVRQGIVAEVTASADVPEPELSVLVRLSEAGGALRQNRLAAVMGWDRTRVSHLLSRMQARGEVARTRLVNGVDVTLLPAGQAVVDAARPALEAAVRRHLIDRLDDQERRVLRDILAKLSD